jgi:hypothetical protein
VSVLPRLDINSWSLRPYSLLRFSDTLTAAGGEALAYLRFQGRIEMETPMRTRTWGGLVACAVGCAQQESWSARCRAMVAKSATRICAVVGTLRDGSVVGGPLAARQGCHALEIASNTRGGNVPAV